MRLRRSTSIKVMRHCFNHVACNLKVNIYTFSIPAIMISWSWRLGWSVRKTTLVIGAPGVVGRQVVSQLIAAHVRVRALARNPDSANLPAQVEIVRGGLAIPDTLDRFLD